MLIMLDRFGFRLVSTFAVMFSVMVLVVLSEFFLVAFPIKTLGQGNWNKSDYSEVFVKHVS